MAGIRRGLENASSIFIDCLSFCFVAGLVVNVVLAVFLMAGHGWARWWMAIRCGIGAITSLASWSGLGQHDFGFFSVIRLWLLASAIFCAAIGVYLMLSRRVNEHFNPSSGF